MHYYPIKAPHFDYGGRNADKRIRADDMNAVANAVAHYVNENMKNMDAGSMREFSTCDLAKALETEFDLIAEVITSMGDTNGITVSKGELR